MAVDKESEAARLQEQIAALQAEIGKLTENLRAKGYAKGADIAESLKESAQSLRSHGEDGLGEVSRCIREKPVQSLGIAVVAGIVLGLIMGRR